MTEKRNRVLLVDDDRSMCETLESCLVRRGYDVAWRTSGRDALALLEGHDFDVVLTDLHMEEMDGLELCRRVIAIRPLLPVIIASAFGTPELRVAGLTAGAREFLAKPFDLEQLQLALSRAVLSGAA